MNERGEAHINLALSSSSKTVACGSRVVKAVCGCLLRGDLLGETCAQNLIKLIEELSKLSIVPAELKCIFALLRQGPQFQQHKQLQQVSHESDR